eukprot:CAMPEP_0172459988 /NCGR_PEP_ID=MMETSP1065-20121228/35050_1 /TAXON_ID=265537 /ORGANISM="Amphiprora paludosa, Strain CCMP125" /LENGTH=57 /DNA_ID=CAMNT_0013214873 /DNA_START=26 /DNA_END=197 /DNA_ORIENTATION=+
MDVHPMDGSSSHSTSDDPLNTNPSSPSSLPPPHQRVWVAGEPASGSYWQDRVVDQPE